jgi:hypothetical protein
MTYASLTINRVSDPEPVKEQKADWGLLQNDQLEYFSWALVYICEQTSKSNKHVKRNLKKMNNQVLKTIIFGALIGAAIFAAPFFVLKVLAFFLIVGLFFRIFRGRRGHYRRKWGGPWGWAYADKIRTMSDEDYQSFKENYSQRCWPEDSQNSDKNDLENQKA